MSRMNQDESGRVDANEGSLGSGKKKSRFGIGVLVGIVIGAVIITGVWGAAKVVSAVFSKAILQRKVHQDQIWNINLTGLTR